MIMLDFKDPPPIASGNYFNYRVYVKQQNLLQHQLDCEILDMVTLKWNNV